MSEVPSLSESFTVDDVSFTFSQRASSDGFQQLLKSRFLESDKLRMKMQRDTLQKALASCQDPTKGEALSKKIELLTKTIESDMDSHIINLDYLWLWASNNLLGVTTFIEFCISEFQQVPDAIERQKKARELAMKIPPRLWKKIVDKANKAGGYGFLEESSGRITGL